MIRPMSFSGTPGPRHRTRTIFTRVIASSTPLARWAPLLWNGSTSSKHRRPLFPPIKAIEPVALDVAIYCCRHEITNRPAVSHTTPDLLRADFQLGDVYHFNLRLDQWKV